MSGKRQIKSNYGVIDHYLGDKGRDYFTWQGENGITQALFNKHLWQPYIFSDDDILDFGCGGGFLLKVLDGRKKVGIEINPYARENAQKLGIEIYSAIDEVESKFDKIISSHALEHVPHPRQMLMELKEKLRDGKSRLLLLLPLDDWRSGSNRYYNPADQNMHLYAWTPQLLGNLISSCGMRVIDIRVIRHAWPPKEDVLWKISRTVFHVAAFGWSVLKKQRQLFCISSLK